MDRAFLPPMMPFASWPQMQPAKASGISMNCVSRMRSAPGGRCAQTGRGRCVGSSRAPLFPDPGNSSAARSAETGWRPFGSIRRPHSRGATPRWPSRTRENAGRSGCSGGIVKARLIKWRELGPATRHFEFEAEDWDGVFTPGQFLSLTAREITRAYSIASPPSGRASGSARILSPTDSFLHGCFH